ncbi:peptide/nickel transport system substrate-binding protein [Haladaptatus litoreus]|uniref:Peptide/nickel transport system substrate-binding protein n=1 Tax=Haladaptatus litoreus TaxID=553468 RepID=A0A1N6UPQ2_9EURY|nr:ABC transporter substrate-binding protein [Haladaptatus litoreus]SIQ67594.1 peptide/nickel transport system substrate-binding protein [Haladaptatus litoreus]
MASRNNVTDRRSFLKAAGGAAAAASLAGCLGGDEGDGDGNGDGNGGGLLSYARGSDSSSLDPQATTSGEDAKVMNQIFDRLIHFKPGETALTKGLATEFNLDGQTATLQLREDAKFHNGEDFTADDFLATYDRFLNEDSEHYIDNHYDGKGNASIYGNYLLGKVNNVSADGDYTLKFELGERYAPFLANLAVFALAVLSKKQIQESGGQIAQQPVGTGPFELDNWNTNQGRIRLAANGDYWGDAPNVDEVVFEGVQDNGTRAQRLLSGESHIVDGLGAQQAKQIEGGDGVTLERTEGLNVGYMAFNMSRVEAFRDKNVRQAISHAINTKAIVDNIYEGLAVQASQPIPPGVMGYNEQLDPYPYNPEKAKELLNQTDYADGFSFELATMNNPRPYFPSPVQTADTVRSNLNEIGINVTVNEQVWDPYLTYTSEGKHDACFLGWMTDNGDPDNFYYALLHPQPKEGVEASEDQDWMAWEDMNNTSNNAAWANNEFMSLIEEGQKKYGDSEREQLYKKAGKIAHDEAPWVYVTHTEELRGISSDVSNFTLAPISGPYLNLVEL